MICEGCAAGADNMADYRQAARTDDEQRAEPLSPGAARRWIKKRARFSMALHCRSKRGGCTCQCEIPELKA
jgi:hypothetical protein